VVFFVFLLTSLLGSYQAYHYTDSDEFCGKVCHSVMAPEYTAYKASPHAKVGCVQCHIGSGATWYVKSKLSGSYQLYSVFAKKYPRPIPSPVENLRPAQETCEQCHWPEKFWGAQLKVFNHFAYDEANTARETRLLIKVGGGSPSSGVTTGIHWHMNIANRIEYVASDRQRQEIPYVKFQDPAGKVTEFFLKDAKTTPEQAKGMPLRRMDCVDCHNRPTHIYVPPDRSVDRALLAGRIDRTLPFVKKQAVTVLEAEYATTDEAMKKIAADFPAYYAKEYPQVAASKKAQIDSAVAALQQVYQTTIFPEMKVDWRTHPDNIGHFYTSGCFRCHDGNHVSNDGRVITKDCEACHSVLGQKEGGTMMIEVPRNSFTHPEDIGDLSEANCSDCHSGGSM
jgi:hypothetical protein